MLEAEVVDMEVVLAEGLEVVVVPRRTAPVPTLLVTGLAEEAEEAKMVMVVLVVTA